MNTPRIIPTGLMALALWMIPFLAHAYEVAILTSTSLPPYEKAIQGFTSGMPTGTKFVDYTFEGDITQGREIGKTIRASEARLVFAVGLKAALVAKLEILDIPVIFGLVMSPESMGLPTHNMTGIRLRLSSQQQLANIQKVLPDLRRLGLLYDPNHSGQFVRQAKQEARKRGLSLTTLPIAKEQDVPEALRALLPKVEALWLIREPSIVNTESLKFLIGTSLDHNIPVFGFSPGLVQHGALASLSTPYREVGHQAAQIAKKLLKQKGRLHLTPQLRSPEHSRLALNLNTAEYLGFSLPQQSLRLADALFGGPGDLAQEGRIWAEELY